MISTMYTAKYFWMITVYGFNIQSKCKVYWELSITVANIFLYYSDSVLKTLAHELHHFKIEKNELGWEIEELEQIADQMRDMQDELEQENDQDMQRAEMIL